MVDPLAAAIEALRIPDGRKQHRIQLRDWISDDRKLLRRQRNITEPRAWHSAHRQQCHPTLAPFPTLMRERDLPGIVHHIRSWNGSGADLIIRVTDVVQQI